MVHYVLAINNCSMNFSSQKSFITDSSKHPFAFLLLLHRAWNGAQTDLGAPSAQSTTKSQKGREREALFHFFHKIFMEFIFLSFICDKHFVLFNRVETCPNTRMHTLVQKKQRVEILRVNNGVKQGHFHTGLAPVQGKCHLTKLFQKHLMPICLVSQSLSRAVITLLVMLIYFKQ